MVLVPEVAATARPFRSCRLRMPLDFGTMSLVLTTKVVRLNATSFCRSRLLTVEPHSRSTVPLAISGMRFEEVTTCFFTCRSRSLSSRLAASTTFMHRSTE